MKRISLIFCTLLIVLVTNAQTVTTSGRAMSTATLNLSVTITGKFSVQDQQNAATPQGASIPNYNVTYQFYPNPAQNDITLSLKADKNAVFNVAIYDVSGKTKVQLNDISLENGTFTHTFNTSAYIPGNYFLKITSKDGYLYKNIPFTKQ